MIEKDSRALTPAERRLVMELQESMRNHGPVMTLVPFKGRMQGGIILSANFPKELDERGRFVIDLRDRCDA